MNYTIFGESHGPAVGAVLTGVPAGLEPDWDFIRAELARRAPGQSALTTARRETDEPEVISGLFEGKTTGAPLTVLIYNNDTRSRDYGQLKTVPRPGHADYAGWVASGGHRDYRGGGHFSARVTAPLVFAGALAKQLLREKGVSVTAAITRVGGVERPTPEQLEQVILAAKGDKDSVGGVISCAVTGLPAGLGAPDLDCNVEGTFARYLFAVPAVKGIQFGAGFALADMRGSQANDPFYFDGDTVRTRTNPAGGINGGITNGMPVTFDLAFRPTPSIAREQDSVDLATGENTKLLIRGRHDPCVLPRALVVVESAAALASWEILNNTLR